jgi:hypothetical protein
MNWSSRESVHGGARCVAGSVGVRNSEGSDRAREAAEAAHAGEPGVLHRRAWTAATDLMSSADHSTRITFR